MIKLSKFSHEQWIDDVQWHAHKSKKGYLLSSDITISTEKFPPTYKVKIMWVKSW